MVRLGICGIGSIAEHYIRLISSGKVQNLSIVALQSRRREHMEQVCRQYGLQAAVTTDYGELLKSNIDAVLICTPNRLHPFMAIEALRAGKHVLIEKPLGTQWDNVQELLDMHRQHSHLKAGVLYNRRTAAAYRFVKEQVGSGEIGRLLRATWLATFHFRGDAYYRSGTWRGTWELEGGGLLMTQAAHQLDLLQWICGSPEVVTACCRTVDRKIETENEATLLLRFPSGATGHFIASGHEMPGVNRLELAGTKGHIILEDDRFFTLRRLVTDSVDFSRESSDPFGKAGNTVYNREFPPEDDAAQHAATLQNFADAVLYGAELVCPLEEGAASLKIILEAYRNTIPAKSW